MALTKETLDRSRCAAPDCGHDHSVVYFHAACHPKADLQVSYIKESGEAVITCARCRKLVCSLAVAP